MVFTSNITNGPLPVTTGPNDRNPRAPQAAPGTTTRKATRAGEAIMGTRLAPPNANAPIGLPPSDAYPYSQPDQWSWGQQAGLDRQMQQNRWIAARAMAADFVEATVSTVGMDEKKLKTTLKAMQRMGVRAEFDHAVQDEARRYGKIVKSPEALMKREFSKNWIEKLFKSAPHKEALDVYRTGVNSYRASAWEYRRYGMYRSIADFLSVCREYPVMSTGVIGTTFVLGAKFPFLGAISGVAILAWSGAASLIHEVLARKNQTPQKQTPKNQAAQTQPPQNRALQTQPSNEQSPDQKSPMNAEKAAHYMNSGENLAAFGITAIGFHGIKKGTSLGVDEMKSVYKAPSPDSPPTKLMKGTWKAIAKKQSDGEASQKMSLTEAALFVSGLFDNVLLPFNWAADRLLGKPDEHADYLDKADPNKPAQ